MVNIMLTAFLTLVVLGILSFTVNEVGKNLGLKAQRWSRRAAFRRRVRAGQRINRKECNR